MRPYQPEQKDFQFTGKHMLFVMFAFFGIIIAVNLTMATMASKSWTGLIVKNSYVASQKYNSELQKAQIQRASGIRSELEYANGNLIFNLKNRDGRQLVVDNLTIAIGRPAFEQEDQTGIFKTEANFTYIFPVALAKGEWAIRITGKSEGEAYRRDARIMIDANGNGSVR